MRFQRSASSNRPICRLSSINRVSTAGSADDSEVCSFSVSNSSVAAASSRARARCRRPFSTSPTSNSAWPSLWCASFRNGSCPITALKSSAANCARCGSRWITQISSPSSSAAPVTGRWPATSSPGPNGRRPISTPPSPTGSSRSASRSAAASALVSKQMPSIPRRYGARISRMTSRAASSPTNYWTPCPFIASPRRPASAKSSSVGTAPDSMSTSMTHRPASPRPQPPGR